MVAYVLAIDQGTTSTRSIIFDETSTIVASHQLEFEQHFPASGWVEHDPEDIWRTVVDTVRGALDSVSLKASDIVALGITNQRETVVVWEKASGRPIANAIVWQDRRTAPDCEALRERGLEPEINAKTGLLLDPYFSATKLGWLLENTEGARRRAEQGELLAGTIDTFLIWRLTGERVHATDATNASRTMLVDIFKGDWDEGLLDLFKIPRTMLPEIRDCAADYGSSKAELFGSPIPIRGVAGDQQAATLGQACFEPGMMKSTYGTGCFALLNTGTDIVKSRNRLLSTIAWQLNGQRTYALEGSIFVAGAAVQWLRDGLGIIDSAAKTGDMAAAADPSQSVYLVPAFVGLGAPHWDADARGALFGLTRNTGPHELAKAALEAVAYQTLDLLEAMRGDWAATARDGAVLRVDGGMVKSNWAMQRLSDLTGLPVDRPVIAETTALGVAWLAGMFAGAWPGQDEFAAGWRRDRRFEPMLEAAERAQLVAGWQDCVRRVTHRC